MLGRDHALLGAAVFLGAGPPACHAAGIQLPLGELAVGTVVCSAFALFPDIDEPGSTVSRKLGPVSRAVSTFTKDLAGGHRQATHSIAFAALTTAGCWFAVRYSPWAAFAIVAAAMLLVARMILPLGIGRSGLLVGAMAIGAAYWAKTAHDVGAWLPVCAGIGVMLHLVGDMLTKEGVPFFWPVRAHLAVPVLGHTQSAREVVLGSFLSLAVLALGYLTLLVPLEHHVPPPSTGSAGSDVHLPTPPPIQDFRLP